MPISDDDKEQEVLMVYEPPEGPLAPWNRNYSDRHKRASEREESEYEKMFEAAEGGTALVIYSDIMPQSDSQSYATGCNL